MTHYILYYHGGSTNHGCEALVRTTADLLNYRENRISLVSFRPDADKKYGLSDICDIHKIGEMKTGSRNNISWISNYLKARLNHDFSIMDNYYKCLALGAKRGDIALSIGGDNYCYGGTERLARENRFFRKNHIKTVLWGCSIEPDLLENPEIAADIAEFDLITARETISYEALRSINPNTVLVSDSAFQLEPIYQPLPVGLEPYKYIGLNLSPLAEKSEKAPGITRRNFENLIQFCLDHTDNKILLIPHVIFDHDNDIPFLRKFADQYQHTGRVILLEDCNCCELKGYISRCRLFVGARTHATIAAYSSCVPTLTIGYSVKSRGIARDLFGSEENYVISVQSLQKDDDLANAFSWLLEHESSVREHLQEIMPAYQARVQAGIEALKQLL